VIAQAEGKSRRAVCASTGTRPTRDDVALLYRYEEADR
jgi:hypothetical protein